MKSRRRVLTLLGAGTAGLAGCGGNTSSSNPTESNTGLSASGNNTGGTPEETPEEDQGTPEKEEEENGPTQREQNIKSGVPLNGLGAYENQMLEAEPTRQPETTTNQIQTLLEETNNPEQEADQLSQILTDENFDSYMAEFYRQKTDNQDTVVVNKNETNATDGYILEVLPVQNAELQGEPITNDTYNGQVVETNKPGETDPEYLAQLRERNWTRMVPQDHDSLEEAIEDTRNDDRFDNEDVRTFRRGRISNWSAGLFGIDESHNIIPHDGESSNVLYNGMYHNENTGAVVELNNEYRDSELFDSDVIVSAEFTESGWEFHRQEEHEMGDKLPGEQ